MAVELLVSLMRQVDFTFMDGYYTYFDTTAAARREKLIAVVTQGVKLGNETRRYTPYRLIAQALAEAGFGVDLITLTFQHWGKAQHDTTKACHRSLPYCIQFVYGSAYMRTSTSCVSTATACLREIRGGSSGAALPITRTRTTRFSNITNISDCLAAGVPMINIGSSSELCAKIDDDCFGVNVETEDTEMLA